MNIGVPPVGVVYQLNVAPGVLDDAVNTAVCPAVIVCVGGVTATSGLFTETVAVALFCDALPVAGSIASA